MYVLCTLCYYYAYVLYTLYCYVHVSRTGCVSAAGPRATHSSGRIPREPHSVATHLQRPSRGLIQSVNKAFHSASCRQPYRAALSCCCPQALLSGGLIHPVHYFFFKKMNFRRAQIQIASWSTRRHSQYYGRHSLRVRSRLDPQTLRCLFFFSNTFSFCCCLFSGTFDYFKKTSSFFTFIKRRVCSQLCRHRVLTATRKLVGHSNYRSAALEKEQYSDFESESAAADSLCLRSD
jgi:hypothetical protein